jgi:phosphoserine phosphatase
MQPTTVLVTVTGGDRPGIVAALFAALAAHDVDIRDVEQVVIRERLVLAVLFELRGEVVALRGSVTQAARALGMECDVAVMDAAEPLPMRGSRQHVIVLGHPLRAGAFSHVTQCIAELGDNIETIVRLSAEPVTSVELLVRSADPTALRAALIQAGEDSGVDVAVESAGLARRAKRLVVLDVDSTLIRDEAVDVLARRAGVSDQVAAITAAAMNGELDFAASLRARAALLAGLTERDLHAVRDELRLTPGARTFVTTLHRLGFQVGVVSGGFTVFTDRFVDELGLDFAAANTLEIVDGRVTGAVLGPIVDRAGKAAALARFADQFGVPLAQTVAVGDGANDIDMLELAGLGIAFNAKSALREAADAALNMPYLDTILFVLGIPREEIVAAAAQ